MHDNNPHRENYTPEPLPFKTGFYEYFAGAILGAIFGRAAAGRHGRAIRARLT